MVAEGRCVITHSAQHSQLGGFAGVYGLEQSPHGKVAAVQRDDGAGRRGALLRQQRMKQGVAARFTAAARWSRQKM